MASLRQTPRMATTLADGFFATATAAVTVAAIAIVAATSIGTLGAVVGVRGLAGLRVEIRIENLSWDDVL